MCKKEYKNMNAEQLEQEKENCRYMPLPILKIKKSRKKPQWLNCNMLSRLLENGTLNEREARVLKYRYGLDDLGCHSLRAIANWLGVSHTTVKNIEDNASEKLKGINHYLKPSQQYDS